MLLFVGAVFGEISNVFTYLIVRYSRGVFAHYSSMLELYVNYVFMFFSNLSWDFASFSFFGYQLIALVQWSCIHGVCAATFNLIYVLMRKCKTLRAWGKLAQKNSIYFDFCANLIIIISNADNTQYIISKKILMANSHLSFLLFCCSIRWIDSKIVDRNKQHGLISYEPSYSERMNWFSAFKLLSNINTYDLKKYLSLQKVIWDVLTSKISVLFFVFRCFR